MTKYESLEQRLIANTVLDPEGGDCWIWLGKIDKRNGTWGYPKLNLWCRLLKKIVTKRAHRVSFEVFKGPISEGYEVDHTCRNTSCINPAHLEAVPPVTNKDRRIWKHTAKSSAVSYAAA
jgi:HNH endonuclease